MVCIPFIGTIISFLYFMEQYKHNYKQRKLTVNLLPRQPVPFTNNKEIIVCSLIATCLVGDAIIQTNCHGASV